MAGKIQQMWDSLTRKNKVFPVTLTKAIYDEDNNRLDNTIGGSDISAIGDGTITGAISTVNTNLSEEITRAKSVEGGKLSLYGFTNLDGVASVAMGYDNSSSALVLDMKLTTGQTHRVSWSNTKMTVAYSTSSGWVTYGTWKVSTT